MRRGLVQDTEGSRLLRLTLDAATAAEVARSVGVGTRAINLLARGDRRPGIDVAFALEKWGIPARSWLAEPEEQGTTVLAAHGRESGTNRDDAA
jgi:transcriptional regulator with XRE-family HTH domain